MTLANGVPFGVPEAMYEVKPKDILLSASGLLPGQTETGLAHVVLTATQLDGVWHVYAIDPNNPPTSPDDVLGSFTEDGEGESGPVDQNDILEIADRWLRASSSVSWIHGKVIPVNNPEDPTNSLGHVLVRATEARE